MQEKIEQLIEISRKYGSDKRLVVAGGGNTSYKDKERLWVKASGYALATISENGFAILDRNKLQAISEKTYSSDADKREEEVKEDLYAALLTKERRPSVETSLHDVVEYAFVVHLHPTVVNGLMCSKNAQAETKRLFGDDAVFVPYTDPGLTLFIAVKKYITNYQRKNGKCPSIVFVQNHGIFVGADTIEEIETIYNRVIRTIEEQTAEIPVLQDENNCEDILVEAIPAIRMMLSQTGELKTLKIRANSRTLRFASSKAEYNKVAIPFTPDVMVIPPTKIRSVFG